MLSRSVGATLRGHLLIDQAGNRLLCAGSGESWGQRGDRFIPADRPHEEHIAGIDVKCRRIVLQLGQKAGYSETEAITLNWRRTVQGN